jgi:formamidopyrimidine-DNA glycosylase
MPEVETTRRHLAVHLPGARVADVDLIDPRAVQSPDAATFVTRLRGLALGDVHRRAKYLLVDLSDGQHLVIHRRMTGNLFLRPGGAPPDAHTVVVLHLADGRELRFCDLRRFARLWLATPAEVAALDQRLGPEPLGPEFTPRRLAAILARRRGALKPLLLDQQVVAGLGNIYVDEALYAAGLHPTRSVDTLRPADVRRLHGAIQQVLEQGIRNEGTSFRDYLGAVGQAGRNQLMVEVFRREGQPCPRCSTVIVKTRVAGRGTHYCPLCQAWPRRRARRRSSLGQALQGVNQQVEQADQHARPEEDADGDQGRATA